MSDRCVKHANEMKCSGAELESYAIPKAAHDRQYFTNLKITRIGEVLLQRFSERDQSSIKNHHGLDVSL